MKKACARDLPLSKASFEFLKSRYQVFIDWLCTFFCAVGVCNKH